MLSKEEFFVLRHYLGEGMSKTAIAKKLGVSRMTVYRHAASDKEEPVYGPRPPRQTLLDPYKDYICGRLKVYPELSTVRLFKEIVERGYPGKLTRVKDFVRSIRPKPPLELERRFEVSPGEQAQVDFATFKSPFGTVYALLVVLSWSRYLWVRFYYHQDQLTVLDGLHRAFVAFGGVPGSLLFERMKTAVARSDSAGKAVFNEEILRFAAHHGFRPRACRPYRAKTKGRVERAVSYLRQSFYYGRVFRDLEDLNKQVESWLGDTANQRIHATTREIPAERLKQELDHLRPLNPEIFTPLITVGRRISKDGNVSYNGNDYSIPEGMGKAEVVVKASLEEVGLYQDDNLLALHPVLEGRGRRRLAPGHRCALRPVSRRPDTLTGPMDEYIHVEHRSLDIYEGVLR
jgi:transposase